LSNSTQQRKRAAVAAAATVAVGAGAAPMLFPAGAAAYGHADCSPDRLCLYSDGGFRNNLTERGVLYDADYRDNTYTGRDVDGNHEWNLNDSISSVWNHSNRWVLLFQNVGFSGHRICFPPETAVRDLHVVQMKPGTIVSGGDSWGNRISGHYQYGGRPSDCNSSGSTLVPESQYGCSM
jgi:hypothetical protein